MRKHTTDAWLVGLGTAVLMATVACAAPPTAEIDQAAATLKAAGDAEAMTYAPDQYRAAQDASAELNAELAVQNEKMALRRSYDQAKTLAGAATTAAQDAAQAAAAEKERVRAETVQLIADAKVAVDEARQVLEMAPTGKGTEADIKAMKSDLDVVASSLADAEAALQTDGFAVARTKAESALRAAQQVKSAVELARTQKGQRPRA